MFLSPSWSARTSACDSVCRQRALRPPHGVPLLVGLGEASVAAGLGWRGDGAGNDTRDGEAGSDGAEHFSCAMR